MKIDMSGEDHSNLLTDSLKLRLKKIVEKLLRLLRNSKGERQLSLSFSIGKAELTRLIEEEKPHVVLRKLILDVCHELDRFVSGWQSAWDYVSLKASLNLLLKRCGADRLSFITARVRGKPAGLSKTLESKRMSEASLVSFRKGKKW
ncbi:MAG: hypothetical protein HY351_05725 [Candidatus Omnitrophica bacterium]|nr:hypothetical protein [Candidatus Omnitrophota bacterium]